MNKAVFTCENHVSLVFLWFVGPPVSTIPRAPRCSQAASVSKVFGDAWGGRQEGPKYLSEERLGVYELLRCLGMFGIPSEEVLGDLGYIRL